MLDLKDPDVQLEVVAAANRAPSIHNVQPALWHFEGDIIELHADTSRRLPISDPTGHDDRISLGAAFEGMSLELTRRGASLEILKLQPLDISDEPVRLIARAQVNYDGRLKDPLAEMIFHRACWRGVFQKASDKQKAQFKHVFEKHKSVVLIDGKQIMSEISKMADYASFSFIKRKEYFHELRRWMRFSKHELGWGEDGLNARSMALSGVEQLLGKFFMMPRVFQISSFFGLGRLLISEASKIRSSTFVVIVVAPQQQDPFETGRAFYRLWLEMTAQGFSLCPMSALSDLTETNAALRTKFSIPSSHRIVNVLRVGISPKSVSLTPRLDPRKRVI